MLGGWTRWCCAGGGERGAAAPPMAQQHTMTDPTPKIRLRGVRKSFGPKVVLDGIDLDVMPGTSQVVIGGSGSGK